MKLFGDGVTERQHLSLFPPGSPYRAADNGYPTYNLAKAKQLVAQAAPDHGGTINIALDRPSPTPGSSRSSRPSPTCGRPAGIKVTLGQIQQVTFIDNW